MEQHTMQVIARIHSDFSEKFGIPRQSGIVPELRAEIVFEPLFRNPDAIRGLDGFSHIWLIWQFSRSIRENWSPTVRPPRLGGNTRLGVFATRSPFRPNPIGLSCVRLEKIITDHERGPVLVIAGADLLDGTPIYDIKPYLPYADCITNAVGGFASNAPSDALQVVIPDNYKELIPPDKLSALEGILRLDPRPPYQKDTNRLYGFQFSGFEVQFQVCDNILTVLSIKNGVK